MVIATEGSNERLAPASGLHIVPGADTGLQKAAVGPTRKVLALMCLEKGEEKSQPSNISMQASVSLTAF